jgi:hypothetical protein
MLLFLEDQNLNHYIEISSKMMKTGMSSMISIKLLLEIKSELSTKLLSPICTTADHVEFISVRITPLLSVT